MANGIFVHLKEQTILDKTLLREVLARASKSAGEVAGKLPNKLNRLTVESVVCRSDFLIGRSTNER